MQRLNYHHLLNFHVAARTGSLTAAAEQLGVGVSTVSHQVHALEAELDVQLFTKVGRNLALTEAGQLVLKRSTEIFELGDDLIATLTRRAREDHRRRVTLGIAQDVPKLVAWQLLSPLFHPDAHLHPVVEQDASGRLGPALSGGLLDGVISDGPLSLSGDRHLRTRVVARSRVAVFASEELARELAPGFPASLDGAPMLLPDAGASSRTGLEAWLDEVDIHPRVVAEFADSSLLKTAGMAGVGALPLPELVQDEVEVQFGLKLLGLVPGAQVRIHLTTVAGREDDDALLRIRDLDNASN